MPGPAAIPALTLQHAQDAAFLWAQRGREASGPLWDQARLGRHDRRLWAHLDGLAAAGPLGWEIARAEAHVEGGAGAWFALCALAAATDRLEAAAAEAVAAGADGERGLSGALAWAEPEATGGSVRRWLVSADAARRRAAVAAHSHHRADPGPRLGALLDDPDAGVRARAARLVGEVGRRDALPALLDRLPAPWPAWAAVLLGDKGAAEALAEAAWRDPSHPFAGVALDALAAALGPAARPHLSRLLARPDGRALALSRVGALGDQAVLPWLVERMRDPADAPAAGAAFRDLAAVEVFDAGLFTEDPSRLGEAFADLDPQPLPIADRVAAWTPGGPPFRSQRALMLLALRRAAQGGALPRWRARVVAPAWA